jgi:hypothetical protein
VGAQECLSSGLDVIGPLVWKFLVCSLWLFGLANRKRRVPNAFAR